LNPVLDLKSKPWYSQHNIYVTGFIIDENGIYTNKDLCKRVIEFKDNTEQLISGEFAAIIIEGQQIYLITDVIRSTALFYKIEDENVYVSDLCYTFRKEHPVSLNIDAAKTFLHSGYTHGYSTLNNDVFQIEAGTIVHISKDKHRVYNYIDTVKIALQHRTPEDLFDILSEVFDDYIKILDGRQVAISLSGGYDSRLILAMFHIKNYDNITCFSYGRPSSIELKDAKTVAETLGCSWHCINYDLAFDPSVLSKNSFDEYCRYASNDAAMFFLKQYFPALYLKEKELLSPDAIIIAGHTGDMISGSHLRPFMSSEKMTRDMFVNNLMRMHFNSFSHKPKLNKIISDSITMFETDLHWLQYESWERINRQAKFIVNSNRAYNYFGYNTLIPLWDRRILEFFRRLPFEQKYHCKLYKHTLKEFIFKPHGIHLKSETHPSSSQLIKQNIKDQIKKVLPKAITNKLVNYSDPYHYKSIIDSMSDTGFEFVIPRQKNIWNAYLVQWYLHKEFDLNHSEIKQILF